MRNTSHALANGASERAEHGRDRAPPEVDYSLLGREIASVLQQQHPEIQRWSRLAGQLFQAEIERAVVQGLASAFRALADQLPHWMAERASVAPPPLAEDRPSLFPAWSPPTHEDAEPASVLRIPLAEQPSREEPTASTSWSEETTPDLAPAPELPSPEAARLPFRRGKEAARAGQLEQAIAHFSEAIRLDPNAASAYLARGFLLRRLRQTRSSLADAEQTLRLNPRLIYAYYLRAAARLRQGQNEEAIADLTRFLEAKPEHSSAYLARGLAHANQGDYERAIADYGRALRRRPKLLLARYQRALAYRLKGDHAVAALEFTRIIELRPHFAPAYFNRALARLALDEHDRAIEDFDKAVELVPQDEEVRARREQALQARALRQDARPPDEPPPAPCPADADDVAPTFLSLECPSCGASARISWKRLDRLFRCRKCSRVFRVNREGHFTEVDPHPVASRRSWRSRYALVSVVALVLIVTLAVGAYARFRRGPVLDELPGDLTSRGQVWGVAWLNNDRAMLRRLTAPTHDRQLHPWLLRHRPPLPTPGASPEQEQPSVHLRVLKPKPNEAVLILRITAPSLKTPVVLRLNWVERGETWYFVPSLPR